MTGAGGSLEPRPTIRDPSLSLLGDGEDITLVQAIISCGDLVAVGLVVTVTNVVHDRGERALVTCNTLEVAGGGWAGVVGSDGSHGCFVLRCLMSQR